MSATFTRKGSYTRSVIRTILGANSIFAGLSESIRNGLIDAAVQKVAALRNSLNKEDYEFDTVASSDVLVSSANEYTKYFRFVIINAGTTYNSTLYASNTILEEQDYGFSTKPTVTFNEDSTVDVDSTSEFEAPTVMLSNWDITYSYEGGSPDNIVFDISASTGIVVVEIYER